MDMDINGPGNYDFRTVQKIHMNTHFFLLIITNMVKSNWNNHSMTIHRRKNITGAVFW